MSKTIKLPDIKYLDECFEYRNDGRLVWKKRPMHHFKNFHSAKAFNAKREGSFVGRTAADGSIVTGLNHSLVRVHRVIYKIFHGREPEQVDHVNGNPSDNRIENLRPATNKQNSNNSKRYSNNKSGYKGVAPYLRKGIQRGYTAQITHNYKKHHLGVFDSAADAHEAYKEAAIKLFGEYWCDGERE